MGVRTVQGCPRLGTVLAPVFGSETCRNQHEAAHSCMPLIGFSCQSCLVLPAVRTGYPTALQEGHHLHLLPVKSRRCPAHPVKSPASFGVEAWKDVWPRWLPQWRRPCLSIATSWHHWTPAPVLCCSRVWAHHHIQQHQQPLPGPTRSNSRPISVCTM